MTHRDRLRPLVHPQQSQIQNILPILNQRSIVSGGVGQVSSSINGALRASLA